MSRSAVYSALVGDTQLSALGIGASEIYASNSMDELPRDKPAIILRWEDVTAPWRGQRGVQRLTIHAHDATRTYDRINKILDRTKEILEPLTHVSGVDGYVLTQMDWRGESGELYDDGFKTNTRYALWDVVARKAS